MSELFRLLQQEWPVVTQAPWAFAAISIACLAAGWVTGRFFGSERIRILLSRIDHKDDEIKSRNEEIASLRIKLAEAPSSQNRKEIRIAIGELISRGAALQMKAREEDMTSIDKEVDAWCADVLRFCGAKLDNSYVQRISNNAGILPQTPTGNLSESQVRAWKVTNHVLTRLNQFLSELV